MRWHAPGMVRSVRNRNIAWFLGICSYLLYVALLPLREGSAGMVLRWLVGLALMVAVANTAQRLLQARAARRRQSEHLQP